jgi:AraC-like DNA-binding protein
VRLLVDERLTVLAADLLYLQAPLHNARFCLEGKVPSLPASYALSAGQGVLLGCSEVVLCLQLGELEVQRLGVAHLAKLLAFIDSATENQVREGESGAACVLLDLAPEHVATPRALEYWYLRQMLAGKDAFSLLAAFLRRLENYWLVKYLVAESSQLKSVSDLGLEYGLSSSHFRRVCKAILGKSAKSELKVWRAARAMLDVVGGRNTMTEVAIKHGYASSSHFSTEIKTLFGLPPREMMEFKR